MPKEITLFLPGAPTEPIQTVNGEMPYRDWLHKEAARINRAPGRVCRVVEKMIGDNLRCWAVGNQHADCVGAPI